MTTRFAAWAKPELFAACCECDPADPEGFARAAIINAIGYVATGISPFDVSFYGHAADEPIQVKWPVSACPMQVIMVDLGPLPRIEPRNTVCRVAWGEADAEEFENIDAALDREAYMMGNA